jgi:hypothetical protein
VIAVLLTPPGRTLAWRQAPAALVPAALTALGDAAPAAGTYYFMMLHAQPCLDWGDDTSATPIVRFIAVSDYGFSPGPYLYVRFDNSGLVVEACSEDACDAGDASMCCE